MDTSYKRRHRKPASCLVCRKRKSKCDRVRPVCGTCKKKLIAHLCVYEDDTLLPPNQSTTYFPVTASPGPPVLYPGHMFPVSQAQLGLPAGGQSHPSVTGLMLPPQGPWTPGKGQYFDLNIPYALPIVGPGQMAASLQYYGISSPHQQHHPQQEYTAPLASPMSLNLAPVSLASHMPQTSSAPQVSQLHPPHHRQTPPIFHYYQSRHSVSSESSHSSPDLSASTALVLVQKLSIPQHDLFDKEKDGPLEPVILQQCEIPSVAVNSTSSMLSSGNITIPSAGSIEPPLIPACSELSPSATISLVSSMTVPPSNMQRGHSSHDEPMFRSLQKRTYAQHTEDDTPNFMSVSIGPNILQIDVNDSMESFSGASHALLVEGAYWQQQGPISYVGLMKSDPYIKLVRSFSLELFKSDQFAQYVCVRKQRQTLMSKSSSRSSDNDTKSGNSEHFEQSTLDNVKRGTNGAFGAKADLESEVPLLVRKTNTYMEDPISSEDAIVLPFISLPGIQSYQVLHSSKDAYYAFVESTVLAILPRKRAVNEAIKRFFHYVSPFIPILHQSVFTTDIEYILRKHSSNGFYTRLTIKNDHHMNIIGQLLLVIKLGYMTLIPNNENDVKYTVKDQELIKDITRFKSDQYISVVNICIPEEKVQTKSTFKYVQSLALLFFYRSVAPNDCLGLSGSDSQLLFGSIVNHALSIGLNRDPTKFDEIDIICKKPMLIVQWRRLWQYICYADALHAMYCGTPLKMPHLGISDVEPPVYDYLLEESRIFVGQILLMLGSYRRIINKITNLQTKPKVIDILQETSQLEKLFLEIFGTDFFRDCVCKPAVEGDDFDASFDQAKHEEAYMKVSKFSCFMHMRANLSCLYYLIALHYEHKLDEDKNAEIGAGIELFKIFIRSVIQLVYIMSYALDNSQELFGSSYDFFITSRIEKSMIKTHNFITSFFIRLVNYKKSLAVVEENQRKGQVDADSLSEDFDLRCEVVDSLFTIALIEAELFVGNFRVLSKTYINSYKLYVMAYFILKQCMENPEKLFGGIVINKEYFHEGTNLLQFLTVSELQSLCKLCEEFRVAKLELIKRQKKHSRTTNLKNEHPTEPKVAKPVPTHENQVETNVDEMNVVPTMMSMEANPSFDAMDANRAMYSNENTINTYGILQEKHMHSDFLNEVFDEQSMIGNEELLKLFELYGDLDTDTIL